jgi:hypothetical protein
MGGVDGAVAPQGCDNDYTEEEVVAMFAEGGK